MDYTIPVCYYDGVKITSENYDIISIIEDKLMCVNQEIDYFYDTIMKIVKKINDNKGFEKKEEVNIKYKFILIKCSFDIYNFFDNNKNVLCETFNVPLEHQMI